jgi:diguanylate cyclase (GGDEF)-like protein
MSISERFPRNIPLTIFFGTAMIAMLWFGIATHIRSEFLAAENSHKQSLGNFARVFDEHVDRTIRELDKALLIAIKKYRISRKTEIYETAIRGPLPDPQLLSDMSFQLAMIDRNGILTRTTIGQHPPKAIDLSDRAHFKIHQQVRPDTPYISIPVLGRRSGCWSVQLTRRVSGADGSFDGVVVASINPQHFARFYGSIDLGRGSVVLLAGFDGIVRAASGSKALKLGFKISDTSLLKNGSKADGTFTGDVDGTGLPRMYARRKLANHPLFVAVAVPEASVFAKPYSNQKRYIAVGVIVSIIVLAAMYFSLVHQRRLDLAREALAESESHAQRKSRELEMTLQHMGQGIIMVDDDGAIVVANDKAIALLDIPEPATGMRQQFNDVVDHMLQRGEFSSMSRSDRQATMRQVRSLPSGQERDYYERRRPDGTVLAVQSQRMPGGGFVRTITDITERHRSAEKIAHLARHDTLTNLANRTSFREKLEDALSQVDQGEGFSVLFLDLDDFKIVNDAHGHPVGDSLLRLVALRLRAAVRAEDIVARVGGDEFAIILSGMSDSKMVMARAQHLVELLREPYMVDELMLTSTASIGCAIAPENGNTAKDLLRNADIALYCAKADGRNTCRLFSSEMSEHLIERRRIEEELSNAISGGELELHYQPLVSIKTGRFCGFEALVRWNHPERGRIPPLDFIPIAEDTGLIVPIGRWVLNEACREAAKWRDDLRIAVNLSPIQFREASLVDDIKLALKKTGLDPNRLELEITETVMMQSGEQTIAKLKEINALGVKISMDDFGTGYSSLNYLRNFAFDKIKIDRSFINELGKDTECDSIVRAIISLADCLSVSTTAEGVETSEQLDALRAMGCEEAQGFLFSPPRPARELQPLLEAMNIPKSVPVSITAA